MVKIKRTKALQLCSYTSAFAMLMNNFKAFAADATSAANNAMTTTSTAATTTKAASGGSMPLIIGVVAIIVIGAVIFMLTKKKDTKIAPPQNVKSTPSVNPPTPRSTVTPPTPTPKVPVVPPTPTPKAPVATPQVQAPVITPKIETPVTPQVQTPVMNTPPAQPKVSAPPVQMPVSSNPMAAQGDAKPLFDSNKLDNDLDNIFNDPKAPAKAEEAQKKAPLFDAGQLDNDLDALFVEVNKKPEKAKEEKKGLFDSSQLDSDLDSLFTSGSEPAKSEPSNNLADLFGSPEPAKQETPAQNQTFDLGSLDFLGSNETKKEESQNSLPSLDLSSLTADSSAAKQEAPAQNQTFDLGSLDFLGSNETKKEEPKSDSFTLPSVDLSSLTGGNTPKEAPVTADTNPAILDQKIDLSTTTMGLNISDYLNSIGASTEKKKESSSFNLSDTIPPQSLNLSDLNINSPVSNSLISETTEHKEKDGSVISIGKMLVDQNALEEIIKKAEKGGKAGLTTTQVITAVKGRSLDSLLVDIDNINGIMGSIIVGKDGLVIANTMPSEVDKDLVGALTSSLFTKIDGEAKKLKKGNLKRLTVETAVGTYILTEIEMGTLVVFTKENQKVNLNNVFKAITTVTGKK